MWMIEEMKEMEELVQVGLQRFLGGGDQQRWWWRKIIFASLMILPFEGVSANFDRWLWKRIEKDEDWALFEAIWLTKLERYADLKIGEGFAPSHERGE